MKRHATIVIVAIAVIAGASRLAFAPPLSMVHLLLASVLIFLGLAPSLWYLSKPAEEARTFPFMPLTGLFYAFFFGVTSLFIPLLWSPSDNGYQLMAYAFTPRVGGDVFVLMLAGTALLLGAWFLFSVKFARFVPRYRIRAASTDGRLRILGWSLVVLSMIIPRLNEMTGLPSIGQLTLPSGFAGFALLILQFCNGHMPTLERWGLLLLGVPLWIGDILLTGTLTPIIIFAVLWAGIQWRQRGTVPLRVVGIFVLIVVIIYPTLGTYRDLIWTTSAGDGPTGRLGALVHSVDKLASQQSMRSDGLTRVLRRTAMILPFAHVVEQSPETVPFWAGETYKPLLTSWIPRFLWPGKPEERAGSSFGLRYGIIDQGDRKMSINIPWVTELYANFGTAGVILGMAAIGILLGLLDALFNRPSANDAEFAVGAAILAPLWFQESNLSLMVGSVLPLVVFFWIYLTVGLRVLANLDRRGMGED